MNRLKIVSPSIINEYQAGYLKADIFKKTCDILWVYMYLKVGITKRQTGLENGIENGMKNGT